MNLLVVFSVLLWFGNAKGAFDTSGCGVTKLCVRNTANCDVSQASCLFFSSAWDAVENKFSIEMSGGSGGGTQYYGMGFSPDGNMQSADVYFCLGNSLLTGSIQQRHSVPLVAGGGVLPGITDVVASTTGGVAMCSFKRAPALLKAITGNVIESFNLSSNSYFVIQARGTWSGRLVNHGPSSRWPSSSALNFVFPLPATSPSTIVKSTGSVSSTSSQNKITVEVFSFTVVCLTPFGLSYILQLLA